MGTYTKLNLFIQLRTDTPENVINFFKKVIVDKDLGHQKIFFKHEDVFMPEFNHDFFKCERWEMLLLSTNWDDNMKGGEFRKIGRIWCLFLDTEFKNYDGEIEKFINFITPYVKGRKKRQYLGFSKRETSNDQDHIWVDKSQPF